MNDGWQWYWDETAGTKTLTVTVTYTDGAEFTSTNTFNVTAPSGTINVNVAQAAVTGNPPSALAPVWMSGVINANNQGGSTGGFIQLVSSMNASTTYPNGVIHGTRFVIPSQNGAGALDQPANSATPYFNQYSKSPLTPNAANNLGGRGMTDSPGADLTDQNGNAFAAASYNTSFNTFLDFQPPNGIHIELAEATWIINFSLSYAGPTPPTQAQFANPANWKWTVNQCQVQSTNTTIQLIKWGINVDTAKQSGAF